MIPNTLPTGLVTVNRPEYLRDHISEMSSIETSPLVLPPRRLLPALPNPSEYVPLRPFLKGDTDLRKCFQFAKWLADLLAQSHIYCAGFHVASFRWSRVLIKGFSALALCCVCLAAHAETSATVDSANEAIVGDDGLGVELKFDENGKLLSVKSTYFHPVEFPDRRGIAKAYIIAEEKAKANIARYMRQVSSSTRTLSEIDESLSKAARSEGGELKSWQKENTRKVIETLEETTGSSAQAVLEGVRVLERRYDETTEEVKVVVGINRQSVAGASQLRPILGQSDTAVGNVGRGSGAFPSQTSENRRARDAHDF